MARLKELNLKRIAFYALGILLCYAGITYMDTWLTKGNQELNDSFNTIDWFCETRIRVLKGNYLLVDTKKERIITKRTVAVCLINNKIYALRPASQVKVLQEGREKFSLLALEQQCQLILQILLLTKCAPVTANLKSLGGKGEVGTVTKNKNIIKCQKAKIINESPTGFYSQEIDLLKL